MQSSDQIIVVILGVLLLIAIAWIVRLEVRLNRLVKGTDQKSLESSIVSLRKFADESENFKATVLGQLTTINEKLKRTLRGVDTIRFNAFDGGGSGGSQSFATAFLDEENNGVVISTLHSRERVGVFAKPLKNGTSEYELTEEESRVIDLAKAKLTKKSQ